MIGNGWPAGILLVRHAESEGNVADRAALAAGAARLDLDVRDADVELSETGRNQAAALGRWLGELPADDRPAVAWCSPYRRAAATAEIAIESSGLDIAVSWDERLRERDLGMFDGLTGTGIREQFPDEAVRRRRTGKFYYRPPGGESWCDVVLRVRSFLRDLRSEHADDQVLIATHQAVILNFRFVLEGLTEAQLMDAAQAEPLANCSVTSYRRRPDGTLSLVALNDVTALESLGEPVTEEAGRHVEN
jgi:broad specificity phosphatase PhoE